MSTPKKGPALIGLLSVLASTGLVYDDRNDHRHFGMDLGREIDLNRKRPLSYEDRVCIDAAERKRQRKAELKLKHQTPRA